MYFFHSIVTLSLLDTNILFNTLFPKTLSLCYSLNASDEASHPYTIGRIVVLYFLIFKFLDSNLEDKRLFTKRNEAFLTCTPTAET